MYPYLCGPAPLASLQHLLADQISLWRRAVLMTMPGSTARSWVSSVHRIPLHGSALKLGLGQYTSSGSTTTDFPWGFVPTFKKSSVLAFVFMLQK